MVDEKCCIATFSERQSQGEWDGSAGRVSAAKSDNLSSNPGLLFREREPTSASYLLIIMLPAHALSPQHAHKIKSFDKKKGKKERKENKRVIEIGQDSALKIQVKVLKSMSCLWSFRFRHRVLPGPGRVVEVSQNMRESSLPAPSSELIAVMLNSSGSSWVLHEPVRCFSFPITLTSGTVSST